MGLKLSSQSATYLPAQRFTGTWTKTPDDHKGEVEEEGNEEQNDDVDQGAGVDDDDDDDDAHDADDDDNGDDAGDAHDVGCAFNCGSTLTLKPRALRSPGVPLSSSACGVQPPRPRQALPGHSKKFS